MNTSKRSEASVAARFRSVAASGLLLVLLAGCATNTGDDDLPPISLDGKPLSGYVRMEEVQVAYIGSAGGGEGTLSYRGRNYPFSVAGLGVGGIGVSSIDASGEVYNLTRLSQFPGAYAQGRYGFALGSTSAGDLWLQNENGVILHVKAKRTGLMLSLGADAVVITMER
jgi:hypothetical protein